MSKLEEVRGALFKALDSLSNPPKGEVTEIQIAKARQITEVSKLILATGVAEMRYNRGVREGSNTKLAFFEQIPNDGQKLIS